MNSTKLITALAIVLATSIANGQNNVGIGNPNPDPSSLLDLTSNDKGILIPRTDTASVNAAVTPADGLLIYQISDRTFYYYDAGMAKWKPLSSEEFNLSLTYDNLTGDLTITDGDGPLTVNIPGSTDNDWIISGNDMNNSNTGNVGVGTSTPAVSLHVGTSDAIGIPAGTTAERPATNVPRGATRFNTDLGTMEVYNGSCWQNINTPPIGATYTQWFNAADPNTIYPCTQWVSTDIENGEFIRARGGDANVLSSGALTGTIQPHALQSHTHTISGSINNSGALTTASAGNHSHNWGGHWSNDDSRDAANGNGDGSGNTLSDGHFWWGHSTYPSQEYYDHPSAVFSAGNHAHNIYLEYGDDEGDMLGINGNDLGSGPDVVRQTEAAGAHTHTVRFYAHRHWLKQRATTAAGSHTHTVPTHTHTHNLAGGAVNSGNTATETRPQNVAVIFWRRIN